ncbi:hypothetical protein Desca_1619 [Desulfotomaculum nigrificans CO-1-SRB]|uniref:Uncharacterized protein n=1 Tax=Desulfotomaculum nigrificans (strain DSM 14880 / VKM B-2319 / CO-1-SRB) TaxID=868595 RepID=F6B743_DESCC|nr:hypothetical protein Desca_1619 [Desulfotomaculum nigrificans CO-1-SRB]
MIPTPAPGDCQLIGPVYVILLGLSGSGRQQGCFVLYCLKGSYSPASRLSFGVSASAHWLHSVPLPFPPPGQRTCSGVTLWGPARQPRSVHCRSTPLRQSAPAIGVFLLGPKPHTGGNSFGVSLWSYRIPTRVLAVLTGPGHLRQRAFCYWIKSLGSGTLPFPGVKPSCQPPLASLSGRHKGFLLLKHLAVALA